MAAAAAPSGGAAPAPARAGAPRTDDSDVGLLSYMQTVLRAREAAAGEGAVVEPTFSRLFVCMKGVPSSFLEQLTKSGALADVTGWGVQQAGSVWVMVEGSNEAAVAFVQDLARIVRASAGQVADARVVAHVEDCPTRALGPFALRSLSLPAEAGVNIETEGATKAASHAYRELVDLGHYLLDNAPGGDPKAWGALLDGLGERFRQVLPSNERVAALATAGRLPTLAEWLDLYASPLDFDASADVVYPLLPL